MYRSVETLPVCGWCQFPATNDFQLRSVCIMSASKSAEGAGLSVCIKGIQETSESNCSNDKEMDEMPYVLRDISTWTYFRPSFEPSMSMTNVPHRSEMLSLPRHHLRDSIIRNACT